VNNVSLNYEYDDALFGFDCEPMLPPYSCLPLVSFNLKVRGYWQPQILFALCVLHLVVVLLQSDSGYSAFFDV